MHHLILTTDEGPLYFVGRVHTDLRRPALFVMGGIWTPEDNLHEVVEWFPGASVIVAPLPGMSGSLARSFDLAATARAADAALAALVPNRPVVTFGVSTGCLVTLAMRSPQVARHVALEPFFRTAPLWPFINTARQLIEAEPDRVGMIQAAWEIFGIQGEKVTDRDYRHLLAGVTAPVEAIVGTEPLEPRRRIETLPSLTGVEDRAAMAAHPLFTLHDGPPRSGHHLHGTPQGEALVKQVLHEALTRELKGG